MKKSFLADKIRKNKHLNSVLKKVGVVIAGILLVMAGYGVNFLVRPNADGETKTETKIEVQTVIEPGTTIELSEEQIPAIIETEEGEVEVSLPTVEAVDSANVTGLLECPEGESECGMGAYIYAPTETPQVFTEYTLGGCFDSDNAFNEQCWDYGDLFWQNYAGRRLSTCGKGGAKNTIEEGCWQINAGDDFEMEWNSESLQYGDIAVFDNGTWGHIGMVVGRPHNGYVALQSQNQGGALCPGSTMGGRVNVINISLKHFAGAFRPRTYIRPPEPEPELPDASH